MSSGKGQVHRVCTDGEVFAQVKVNQPCQVDTGAVDALNHHDAVLLQERGHVMRKAEMRTVEAEVDTEVYLFFVVVGQVEALPQLGDACCRDRKENKGKNGYFSPQ